MPRKPTFHDIFALFPIRDPLLRLMLPNDVEALCHAMGCDLRDLTDSTSRYLEYWFADAGMSVTTQTQQISLCTHALSLPRYYGDEVVSELPKFVRQWLEKPELEGPHYYRRLNIKGESNNGNVQFIVEDFGSSPEAALDQSWLLVLRIFVGTSYLDGHTEQRIYSKDVATREDRKALIQEIMHMFHFVARWTHIPKTADLFPWMYREIAASFLQSFG